MESRKIILGMILIVAILGGAFICLKVGNSHMMIGQYHEYQEVNSYVRSDGVNSLDLENMNIKDYLIIYDEEDVLSTKIKDNISKTLDYAKKPYIVQEVSSYS